MTTAYPLTWPEGWPRTKHYARKSGNQFKTTWDKARRDLNLELQRLGAKHVVVSSWLALRQDGQPRADAARMRIPDPGVAVYFELRGRPMVLARDAYPTVHDNLRSICLAIEHLRGLERHGGGTMMERAFEGFAALPTPKGSNWWEVLSCNRDAGAEEIAHAFRRAARMHHPDMPNGSEAAMQAVTAARDAGLAAAAQRA